MCCKLFIIFVIIITPTMKTTQRLFALASLVLIMNSCVTMAILSKKQAAPKNYQTKVQTEGIHLVCAQLSTAPFPGTCLRLELLHPTVIRTVVEGHKLGFLIKEPYSPCMSRIGQASGLPFTLQYLTQYPLGFLARQDIGFITPHHRQTHQVTHSWHVPGPDLR